MFNVPSTEEIKGVWTREDQKIIERDVPGVRHLIRPPFPGELEALTAVPSIQKFIINRLQKWIETGAKTPSGLQVDEISIFLILTKNRGAFRFPCLHPHSKKEEKYKLIFAEKNGTYVGLKDFLDFAIDQLDKDNNPIAPLVFRNLIGMAAPIKPDNLVLDAEACASLFGKYYPFHKIDYTSMPDILGPIGAIFEKYTKFIRWARFSCVMSSIEDNEPHCVVIDQRVETEERPNIHSFKYSDDLVKAFQHKIKDSRFIIPPPVNHIRHIINVFGEYHFADLELDDDTIIGLSGLHYNLFNNKDALLKYVKAVTKLPDFNKIAKQAIKLGSQETAVVDVTYKAGLVDHAELKACLVKDILDFSDEEIWSSEKTAKLFTKPEKGCVRILVHPKVIRKNGHKLTTAFQDVMVPKDWFDYYPIKENKQLSSADKNDLAWFKNNKGTVFRIRPAIKDEKIQGELAACVSSYVLVLYGIGGGQFHRFYINKPTKKTIDQPWIFAGGQVYTIKDLIEGLRRNKNYRHVSELFKDTPTKIREYNDWILENPEEVLILAYENYKVSSAIIGLNMNQVQSTCYDEFYLQQIAESYREIEGMPKPKKLTIMEPKGFTTGLTLFSQWMFSDFPVYYPTDGALTQALNPCLMPDDRLPIAIPHNALFIDLRKNLSDYIKETNAELGRLPLYTYCHRIRIDPLFKANPIARLNELKLSHILEKGINEEDREKINAVCIHKDIRIGILISNTEQIAFQAPQCTNWTQWRVYGNWLVEREKEKLNGHLQQICSGLFYTLAARPPARHERTPAIHVTHEGPSPWKE